ncbi:putative defensin-like protein 263 [Mercurialis annua]|uniref:putative defensin-like protein 263 n=1 Tax=Mercurialis annua TaxID=3986 RepID=UPI00215F8A9F|nr:putative defensin-like protein 263 [Mercurialis annua]
MAKACMKMAILFFVASHCILLSMACENKEECVDTRCDEGQHAICLIIKGCICVPNATVNQVSCHKDKDCKPLCPPNCGITNCIGGRCICSC